MIFVGKEQACMQSDTSKFQCRILDVGFRMYILLFVRNRIPQSEIFNLQL